MLDYSTSYFLSDYWANVPLYAEKIIPLLDYILSNNFSETEKLAGAFYELIDKYQNTAELPIENIKEYIKENGYGYILDLLNDSNGDLKILVYLLVLIHQLKGSKKGIQTVLSLFQLDAEPSDTQITEWYETLPVGVENTFTISSKVDVSKAGNKFFQNFAKFIKSYVYPELIELRVRYATKGQQTFLPYIQYRVKYVSKGYLD